MTVALCIAVWRSTQVVFAHSSLNREKRQRELLRVTRENQEILKRINMRKPEYSVQQWARDWGEPAVHGQHLSVPQGLVAWGGRCLALCCGRCWPDHQDFIIWCVISRFALSGMSLPGFHHLGGFHHQVFIIWCVITRFALSGVSSPGFHHGVRVCVWGGGGGGGGVVFVIWVLSSDFHHHGCHHQVFIIWGTIIRFSSSRVPSPDFIIRGTIIRFSSPDYVITRFL